MESLFKDLQNKNLWVAFSGGLDSHVLLHMLAQTFSQLKVIHVHHGLSPYADQWADHCAAVCQNLQVEFHLQKIDAKPQAGQSPEAAAREKRYQVFAQLMQPNDVLVTAHHQNDQAETMLLQMLRGAGPKGLAAMPVKKALGLGFHIRPLLNMTRNELLQYAQQHDLKWIEDESNHNKKLTRNFIRHDILPALQERWQNVTATLTRSAELCAEHEDLLAYYIQQELNQCKGTLLNTLSIKKLLQLDTVRQKHVIRVWLSEINFPLPSAVKLQQILKDMLTAREDRMPHVSWGDVELRRYRDNLFALAKLPPHDPTQVFEWDLSQPYLQLPTGTLTLSELNIPAEIKKVTVRYRQGGEKLKKLFQEWGVPPWLRDRIPLVFVGDPHPQPFSHRFALGEGSGKLVVMMT